ncbi:MAG: hypothetical protein HYY40_11725 [Bacteroidetes bacterium]|nr:hypothetical protein [Bacteroidota bacterium]
MQDKKTLLIPDATYHIFNRANGNEHLFYRDENYLFFLGKYEKYISPVAETFCYCLMPNHFHFIIRIKNEVELEKHLKSKSTLTGFQTLSGLNENALSKLLSRKGNLFMRPFKRKRITDEKYLKKVVHYTHYNPVEAGLISKPEEWKYSSYNQIINPDRVHNPVRVESDEVIEWFGDKENFIYCHKYPPQETGIEEW